VIGIGKQADIQTSMVTASVSACHMQLSLTSRVALGLNLQNFVRRTFAVLSQFFHMSANKLSYEKFTKELQKKHTID